MRIIVHRSLFRVDFAHFTYIYLSMYGEWYETTDKNKHKNDSKQMSHNRTAFQKCKVLLLHRHRFGMKTENGLLFLCKGGFQPDEQYYVYNVGHAFYWKKEQNERRGRRRRWRNENKTTNGSILEQVILTAYIFQFDLNGICICISPVVQQTSIL